MLVTLFCSSLVACFRPPSSIRLVIVLVDHELCSTLLGPSYLEIVFFAVEESRRLASVLAEVFSQRVSLRHMLLEGRKRS